MRGLRAVARGVLVALCAMGAGAVGAVAASGGGNASLLVDVEPREPWVGQPVVLRVRLVLLRDLAEEPAYVAPATTGFWAEPASRPESYYATQSGRRVLVTETRTRLYPLAPGVAHVGAATADLVFAHADASRWNAERAAREQSLRSAPVSVNVRPLPAGAPPGFDGAVGTFTLALSADRTRTSQDVPVAVRLDVRGSGNLPLIEAPELVTPGAEVLVGTSEDSLPAAGSTSTGRVRFHWNVLAGRAGTLAIEPPLFVWFDPATGGYRTAVLPLILVEVAPPLFSSGPNRDVFPAAFVKDAPAPFARGVRAWAWALAGLLLGGAIILWRRRTPADPLAEERVRVAAWRNSLRGPGGPAFWRAAEEAVEWLGRKGRSLGEVREQVATTRYGGAGGNAVAVGATLQRELASALPAPRRALPARALAVTLLVVALLAGALGALRPGGDSGAVRLRAADRAAREGDVAGARASWLDLWEEGARAPALAARLAWVELREGRLAPATVWVLRGERSEARDHALAWVSSLVREGGGLAGARPVRTPLRHFEWALLALLLGVVAGAVWPRRGWALALAILAVAAAGVRPLEDAWAARLQQAVVARTTALETSGLQLETGQVVEVLDRQGSSARVRVGRDVVGRIRADALLPVREEP